MLIRSIRLFLFTFLCKQHYQLHSQIFNDANLTSNSKISLKWTFEQSFYFTAVAAHDRIKLFPTSHKHTQRNLFKGKHALAVTSRCFFECIWNTLRDHSPCLARWYRVHSKIPPISHFTFFYAHFWFDRSRVLYSISVRDVIQTSSDGKLKSDCAVVCFHYPTSFVQFVEFFARSRSNTGLQRNVRCVSRSKP